MINENNIYLKVIAILILIISLLYLKFNKKSSLTYMTLFLIFYVYMINVFKLTLLPIPIDPRAIAAMKGETVQFFYNLNYIPFRAFDKNMLLNIILLVPYGFFIRYLTRKGNILIHAVFLGLFFEAAQTLISLATNFNYRTIDIDDAIANFLGVLLGYAIHLIFSVISYKVLNKISNKNSFLEHIFQVSKLSLRK
ncbi:hypothetical protein BBD42_04530 [Paenibacillus sp. BIHB 4019]|uniref:VanZ-like domain-containing protein n=1 Tax=Paenibacillus sp. BIHB 4019 TaxID=1870819 RepID=A0A1B2DDN4_9BACL|nr:VanZ family protein [Paenibacillus sp. BIHB 4019]ANY65813.1 hypothetical protein BBD42_04530 [Paenibacillus sp. BIHB 4019]